MFGARVTALREARGWSKAELARRSGLTLDSIRNYELGRRTDPPVSTIVALAAAFEVPPGDLLTDPPVSELGVAAVI